jgi:hypothetical protein
MKTILKLTIPILLLIFSSTEILADIQVIVYGKGGIIVKPDSTTVVCPEWSSDKCADITIEDGSLDNQGIIMGTLLYEGRKFQVEIIEMPDLKKEGHGYSCQGIVVKKL